MYIYSREGKPGNFKYRNKLTNKIEKQVQKFIDLKIPPAYKDVVISENLNDKVLAYGYDSKGRKQIIYNRLFIESQSTQKYSNIEKFALIFNQIENKVNKLISLRGLCYEKVIAIVIYIIIHCNFRIGNKQNVEKYESYGITTLRSKHIIIQNNTVFFSFIGKKSILNEGKLINKYISEYLKFCKSICKPDESIFVFETSNGKYKTINALDINNFLKNYGSNISSKTIRTFKANQLFVKYIKYENNITNKSIKNAIDLVSNDLHNTSTVCKNSYIHPDLLEFYLSQANNQ